jgi:hypothetical protein
VRPGGDDLVQGDGGAAAGDAVDGADRPGHPVPVADVFATTCARMPASPSGGAHRDDSWHRQDGRVGLADLQGHERDELVAEGAEVKALAEGFERAVSGEMPQPGVDSQEPGEDEPSGIGQRPAGSWGAVRNETALDGRQLQKSSPESSRSPAWSGRVSIRARRDGAAMASVLCSR